MGRQKAFSFSPLFFGSALIVGKVMRKGGGVSTESVI